MVSTFCTLEPFTNRPRVFDVDDAIWLHSRGHNIEKTVRQCDHVICGNPYIADWAGQHNREVSVLPTAVDTDRFRPSPGRLVPGEQIVIGWMGQSSGYRYLNSIREVIQCIRGKYQNVIFRVVSDAAPPDSLSRSGVEFVKWSEDTEIGTLQSFDIGIMPIENSPWCRGKCSYKMLLYMACAVPVVVSDFGMNSEVLKRGSAGCGVSDNDEWIQALEYLIDCPSPRVSMGRTGRTVVEQNYSLRVLAPRFAELLGTTSARCNQEARARG
jgi:glycosyltransferase involved in cell wall biosynthesis